MASRRRIYPRPPIVEAVIDLRFDAPATAEAILTSLASSLADQYQGPQKQQQRVEVATSGRRVPHLTFLQSANGRRFLGCAQGLLSVHVLAPYPGWESFIEQARDAVLALPNEVRVAPLTWVGVRYIDKIVLPSTDVIFDDYLKVMPAPLPAMPQQLAGFQVTSNTVDPTDGTQASLTVASTDPDADGKPVVIYDLALRRSSALGCLAEGRWGDVVEELHQRQRDVFEASITDQARGLFE
jgi:uncharacterized protein (TIGR04255 family)